MLKAAISSFGRCLTLRHFTTSGSRHIKILGIETSCDDTGCGIVDEHGNILGECLQSQGAIHVEHGGIIPPIARDLHLENIESVVHEALLTAKLKLTDVDAIAVTVKPGLPLSLLVGTKYARFIAEKSDRPIIPIHHMEAHALTVRMTHHVEFPFVVLLISGGHCLLAIAEGVDRFLLLGKSLDDAPGEAFDKIARRLKVSSLKYGQGGVCGGQAMEEAAKCGDPTAFPVAEPLLHARDCNFSFAGIKNSTRTFIMEEEAKHGVEADGVIPTIYDMCASVQFAITKHLCRRVKRALSFAIDRGLVPPESATLVVSGGVASNGFIRLALIQLCGKMNTRLLIPEPHLCTDNGVMIAWNGVERWRAATGVLSPSQASTVDIIPKCPFGEDISEEVKKANIKCSGIVLKELLRSDCLARGLS